MQTRATSGLSEPQQQLVITFAANFQPFLDASNKFIERLNRLIAFVNDSNEAYRRMLELETWENEGGALG